ncbi:MAG: hypothetical protein WB764_26715 [Xanthobacteraceae bacterium]
MSATFDTREDELSHAIGQFFIKWSWLEDALTYLLESLLNVDEQFCGLLHTHLSIDSKLTLLTIIGEEKEQKGLLEYERDYLKRLISDIRPIKNHRNILAHQPLIDLFGNFPQSDELGPIAALGIRVKKSGKSDVPIASLDQTKEYATKLVLIEKGVSELAQSICMQLNRRVK